MLAALEKEGTAIGVLANHMAEAGRRGGLANQGQRQIRVLSA